ncbi:hypothetical protein ABVT39_014710 [Epinephelus coioides]
MAVTEQRLLLQDCYCALLQCKAICQLQQRTELDGGADKVFDFNVEKLVCGTLLNTAQQHVSSAALQLSERLSDQGSDEHTELLISWRTDDVDLFTGKRNAAVKGYEMFVVGNDLQGKVQPAWVKKKWENLKQKYKDLKCPRTGVSTEGAETTAATWKCYGLMDAALGSKPSISPPLLISSAGQATVVVSPPSVSNPAVLEDECQRPRPRKRGREEGDVFNYLQEMEEKEAIRESVSSRRRSTKGTKEARRRKERQEERFSAIVEALAKK